MELGLTEGLVVGLEEGALLGVVEGEADGLEEGLLLGRAEGEGAVPRVQDARTHRALGVNAPVPPRPCT